MQSVIKEFPEIRAFQTLVGIGITSVLVKANYWAPPWSFLLDRSGVGLANLHFQQVLR